MTAVWIYFVIGAVVGLGVLISGCISAGSDGQQVDGTTVFLCAFVVALFSVPLWPLTLVGVGCALLVDRRDARAWDIDRVGTWEVNE